MVFILYGLSSFAALGLHINDDYWMSGLTSKSLLSHPYLAKQYIIFQDFENSFPYLISLISIFASIFQSIFQFLMLFLIFNKIGRWFVFLWGMNFFILSLFVIQLSYLPHIEIIIWLTIFLPVTLKKDKIKLFYDDYCNLCKKSMLFFKKFNINDSIEFFAISKSYDVYNKHSLTEKDVKAYMAGIKSGKVYIGYDLYYEIVKANPLYWVFIPFFFSVYA